MASCAIQVCIQVQNLVQNTIFNAWTRVFVTKSVITPIQAGIICNSTEPVEAAMANLEMLNEPNRRNGYPNPHNYSAFIKYPRSRMVHLSNNAPVSHYDGIHIEKWKGFELLAWPQGSIDSYLCPSDMILVDDERVAVGLASRVVAARAAELFSNGCVAVRESDQPSRSMVMDVWKNADAGINADRESARTHSSRADRQSRNQLFQSTLRSRLEHRAQEKRALISEAMDQVVAESSLRHKRCHECTVKKDPKAGSNVIPLALGYHYHQQLFIADHFAAPEAPDPSRSKELELSLSKYVRTGQLSELKKKQFAQVYWANKKKYSAIDRQNAIEMRAQR
ncbi:hypothetical protein DFS34DRAFT_390856 [Phlyctochytrium arcticum]|nr:hypothetical protein DFS34DRAFT_390856 [Phlyctochytrium arcticum]